MKTYFGWTLTIILFAVFLNCEKNLTPVVQNAAAVDLQIEEVMVTETWLKLSAQNLQPDQRVVVWRDSLEIYRSNNAGDTVIYDHALQPAHSYSYRAGITDNRQLLAQSQKLPLTTMDTTSHNFSWSIDTIGTHSSTLYDVAIINENDIWAVGEIHTPETDKFDSLGNWVPPYNAVHWDGQTWNLERLLYKGGFWTIHSILAFSADDIFFEFVMHWDGSEFKELDLPNFHNHANKMWGVSSSDFYIVGNNGLIGRYHSQSWARFYSGTNIDLRSVSGNSNNQIYCCGYVSSLYESILLKYAGKNLLDSKHLIYNDITDPFMSGVLQAVWVSESSLFLVSSIGIMRQSLNFQTKRLAKWPEIGLPIGFVLDMDGSFENNVFVAGESATLLHFNGARWNKIAIPGVSSDLNFRAVAAKNEDLIVVGKQGGKAFLVRGMR